MASALPQTAPVVAKEEVAIAAVPSTSTAAHTGVFAPITNLYSRLQAWRQSLELPNPGTVEGMQSQVKCTWFESFVCNQI
jgi:mitochondrial import receptor subunit TOM40